MVELLELSQHPVPVVPVMLLVPVMLVALALHGQFWLSLSVVEVGPGWLLQHAFSSQAGLCPEVAGLCWQVQKMVQLVPKSRGLELPAGSAVLLLLHFGESIFSEVASGVASWVACRPLCLRGNVQPFSYGKENKEKRRELLWEP